MPFFVKGEKIILKRDGTWVADGTEITHEQTRDTFFKSIRWDEKERKYCLEIGYEVLFIEVEDTPYFVTSVEPRDGAAPLARLSNFTELPIRSDRIEYRDGSLYLRRDDGQRARFLSAPYYDLLRGLQEDDRYYFLTIAGERVNLSPKGSGNPASRPGAPERR